VNFFEHQQQARVSTRRLLLLFAVAVIGMLLVINAVAAWAARASGVVAGVGLHTVVTLAVLGVIGLGALVESLDLRKGGDAVARMVGARVVDPGTGDALERRLLNVVEEMSIASGTPVPRVYLMDDEQGINAFAAGNTVSDAVVAVTRGALDRLTRDELQGVIAHEFSHILHGDMQLNMRLIALLFGLTMVGTGGRHLIELAARARDSKVSMPLGLVGLVLWLAGALGVFVGRLIKAAVSRQREYLADASAVQFTRNPEGIAGALRKIGGLVAPTSEHGARPLMSGVSPGSVIAHRHAETLSHLFLGAARRPFASGLFATHPTLADRLRRIDGCRVGMLASTADRTAPDDAPAHDAHPAPGEAAARVAAAAPDRVIAAIGHALASPADGGGTSGSWQERARALGLEPALREPEGARLLVLALLLDDDAQVAQRQRHLVIETLGPEAVEPLATLHAAARHLPPGGRLPLLDLAMPALRRLPLSEAERLIALSGALIAVDGRMSLLEFLLVTIVRRRLASGASARVPPRFRTLRSVRHDASRVLSLIAMLRRSMPPAEAFARAQRFVVDAQLELMPAAALSLEALGGSLDRLNRLMPLVKPGFIKACAAAACDEACARSDWRAASALRMICSALDAPLPPHALAAIDRAY